MGKFCTVDKSVLLQIFSNAEFELRDKFRFTGNLTLPFLGSAGMPWPLPFLPFPLSCHPFPITAAPSLAPQIQKSVTFF